ncbi:hypothetical protein KVF89_11320 [Nocardioides carbamazepini]|uniref:hypothetical protein n=1 Tax=Nocardioides carbamazepini TaxID=2854259 RepID=UPI002149A2EE|nr:hypothetical protein [Nocardioides carbamazepini]MCR1783123.1 hypothetical protein [Nocardioides carbamazepini]
MHRKSTAEKLRDDLRELVDAVVPDVESAVHTIAERTPPLVREGRAVAVEKGTHAAETLSRRLSDIPGTIPSSVVDRLPDAVSDHLPQPRRRRKALLVLATLGLVGAAGAVASRRRRGSEQRTGPASYPRAVEEDVDAVDAVDPTDPLVEPRIDDTRG